MSEICVAQPTMPMLTELMGNIVPVQNPQVDWGTGLIGGYFHKKKVNQRAEIAEAEQRASEAKTRNASAVMAMLQEMQTFGAKQQDIFHELGHRRDMRNIEKEMAIIARDKEMIAKEISQALLVQEQLKNLLLQGEVKLTDIKIKVEIKGMEDICGPQSA